jgi:hypothetical protein
VERRLRHGRVGLVRRSSLPPAPILRSLAVTTFISWGFLRALTLALGVPVDAARGILWTFSICLVLIWVEIHRRRLRFFLLGLGVPRRSVLALAGLLVAGIEIVLQVGVLIGGDRP